MAPYDLISTEQIKQALIKSGGYMTHAAALLKCDHSTISKRVAAHPELREIISEARENLLDDAEKGLHSLVLDKEFAAICFALKTVGKKRGYTETAYISEEAIQRAMDEIIKRMDFVRPFPLSAPSSSEDKEASKDHNDLATGPCSSGPASPNPQSPDLKSQ